jgi:hypothetical protein
MSVDEAAGDVGEIGLGVDRVELAGLDQRGDHAPLDAALVGAGEQRVLAVEGDRPAILPMSGRKSRSTIAGTPSMGVVCGASAARSV